MSTAVAPGTVTRSALLDGLSFVAKAMPKKAVLDILTSIRVECVEEGLLLEATDLDGYARTIVPGDVHGDGKCVVAGKDLLSLAKALPNAQVEIEVEADGLTLTIPSAQYKLPGRDIYSWPLDKDVDFGASWSIARKALASVTSEIAAWTVAEDNRPALRWVGLDVKDETLRFTASNAHVIARAIFPLPFELVGATGGERLVPPEALALAAELPGDDAVQVAYQDGFVAFRCGQSLVRHKTGQGPFLPVDRVLSQAHYTTSTVVDRTALLAAVRRALVLSNEFRRLVLQFSPEDVKVSPHATTKGSATESVPTAVFDGDSVQVGFDGDYLTALLAKISGESVRFGLGGTDGLVSLASHVDQPDREFYVLPQRLG